MRRLIAFALTFFCVLGLVGCNNRTVSEPEMYTSSMQDDFPNAIPAEVNDNIIQNCKVFSENLLLSGLRYKWRVPFHNERQSRRAVSGSNRFHT